MASAMMRYYATKGATTIRWFKSGASANATFKAGDLVKLNGTGTNAVLYNLHTASATVNTATAKVLGMALRNATGSSSASSTPDIPVIVADETTHFLLPAYNSTAASAVPSAVNVGEQTTLYFDSSTGITGVNVPADSTNPNVTVIGKVPGIESETYAPLWVKVNTAGRTIL